MTKVAYNPAEGNNPYTPDQLEAEWSRNGEVIKGKTPEERRRIINLFLELLAEGASVTKALQTINQTNGYDGGTAGHIGRKTLYAWRKYDDEFREDWDEAFARGTDKIEDACTRFALEGNPSLLKFSLMYRNSMRYGPGNRSEVTGANGEALPTRVVIEAATAEDAESDDS